MSDLFLDDALIDGQWTTAVRVTLSDSGDVTDVRLGATPGGCERIRGVVVPGIPNLHSHAFQRAMAGLAERGSTRGDTFWSWRERMYRFLERIGPEDVEAVAAQLHVELLRHGYTSVTEFHYLRNDADGNAYDDPAEMGKRILAAADTSGIGVTLLPVLYRAADFGGVAAGPGQRRFTATVDELLRDIETLAQAMGGGECRSGRVGLALHSLRAVAPADLARAVEETWRRDADAPVHIHVAEQLREVEACQAWSGMRPVEWLLEHAPVDERWCLIHATHMSQGETLGLARTRAVVGLCPTTEANLGDGLFPFAHYQAAGGRWGVGTDSHISVSPVADLRLLEYGQRLHRRERNVAAGSQARSTGRVLLDGAWSGGAQAAGRPLGGLSAGRRCDLVVLDPDHPALVGRSGDDLLDAWVFSGEDTPVRDVMVGGRWVVQDGRHVSQSEIAERYRTVARGLAAE